MFATERNGYKPTLIEDICRWAYSFVLVFVIPFAFLQLMLRGATRIKTTTDIGLSALVLCHMSPKKMAIYFTVFLWGKWLPLLA